MSPNEQNRQRGVTGDRLARLIIENATDFAIITCDLDRRITSWNPGAEKLFGWSEAEALGRDACMIFTPEDLASDACEREMRTAAEHGRAEDERLHRRKDGSLFWASGLMMRFEDEADGELIGYLKIMRDLSSRRATDTALFDSEARFRNMADHAPVMMWVTDRDARCQYLNRAWYEFTGQTEAEGEGFGWLDAVHPDDRGWSGEVFLAANAEHKAFRLEYRLRRHDGTFRWAIDAASPRFGLGGEFLGYIGSVIDIDERREAEDALRRSEERYRTLFNSIESGFCVAELTFDAPDGRVDYRIVEANPAFYQQTGFPEGILGRWLREAAPGLEEHWYERYGRVAQTGEPERFEQGSAVLGRWFDVYAFRVGEAEERRVAILFNDISARRNAEEQLRELNETLEAEVAVRTAERDRMWDISPALMLVIDFEGYVRRVSPAWTRLLGYTPEELVGHHVNDFVLPEDHHATIEAYESAAAGGRPTIENRYRHKDGSVRWISWVAAPAGDMTYATGRDITAEKEAAVELERAQEALRQSQKMEAVGQLTGGLAHDFNNLLAGISGSLELLRTRIAQGRLADVERYLVAAQGASKRAAALTHRLLAFSRRQTLDPKSTNIGALISGMEDLVRRTVGPSISVESVAGGGVWNVLVDPNQLENALLNLCINARDAMPDGGKITIETANRWLDERAARQRDLPPGQYVSLCVSDNGTGMSPDVIEKAFDPFFTTKPIGMGTGLGLSMIYGFARQSGGQVRIYSELGQGTMVCIYLPRHLGESEEVQDIPVPSGGEHAETGETVLVIDDEPLVRMLVVDALEELGYTAIEAGDGPSGLKVIQSDARIDLLITDVGLPNGMNGRQVADRARELRPELKILFVTGYAENAVLNHGHLEHGMQVVTKPFDMAELTRRIKAIISEG